MFPRRAFFVRGFGFDISGLGRILFSDGQPVNRNSCFLFITRLEGNARAANFASPANTLNSTELGLRIPWTTLAND